MNPPDLKIPTDGLSPKIKIFVIVLTIITIVAFSAFFIKLATKIASPSGGKNWANQLKLVGDELNKAGLKKQAIEQYIKFLEHGKINLKTRAKVSQTLGKLYTEEGNCSEALVWFYHAKIAEQEPSHNDSLKNQINNCLERLQSPKP